MPTKILKTINPATELVLQEYLILNAAEIETAVITAQLAFTAWKKTTFAHRRQLLLNLEKLLYQRKEEYASLIAAEMGKPISAGVLEIEKCAKLCAHYAEHGEYYLSARLIKTEMHKAFVCYQPQGVVLAIMPWNFPFWQILRAAIPAIMAGNVVIVKPAPITIGTSKKITELFLLAGFANGVLQSLVLDNALTLKLIAHKYIRGVTFTGSVETGKIIAMHAGKWLKKSVLELGGNDPYIILADADLDLVADCIVTARLNNCGQVCIAPKRAIVVQSVHDNLVTKIIDKMSDYQMGDPQLATTNLGPMARADLRNKLQKQVLATIKAGAKLVMGGKIPRRLGFYYPPTLLLNVKPAMPAFSEELFGPVISISTAIDEAEAIKLANDSLYGLGGGVFTNNIVHGEQIAKNDIEVGVCFVNGSVHSDPRLPFGGVKHSGFGRELSREGILEFVNVKTIAINDGIV